MCQDIDYIEYRSDGENIEPVALIETGRMDRSRFTDTQEKMALTIANALEIPAFFVEYHIDENDHNNNRFKLKKISGSNGVVEMSNREYAEFLMHLRGK